MVGASLYLDYLAGSPAADQYFIQARSQVYDHAGSWVQFGEPDTRWRLARGQTKMGPLSLTTLSPALGWEMRSADSRSEMSIADVEKLKASLQKLPGWQLCQINALSPAEALHIERCFCSSGHQVVVFDFPVRVISGPVTYSEYLKRRSSSHNKSQRRSLAAAEKAGLEFRSDLDWIDILSVLDSRNRAFQNGEDYSQTESFRKFLYEFRHLMKEQNRLIEVGLFEEGRLIGFDIGFLNDGVFHSYQTAYNAAYSHRRPGALTLEKLIEVALERGAKLIDFMGDNLYLHLFTPEVLILKRVVIFSRTPKGMIAGSIFRLKNREVSRGNKKSA